MIASVVDNHQLPLFTPIVGAKESFQEVMKRYPVKLAFLRLEAETAGTDVDRTPVSNLFSGGCGGDLGLRAPRPPHPYHTGSLLKMDLILSPDSDLRIA